MPPENIPAPGATITRTVAEAVDLLGQAQREDVIFITGSLFVVGEARALLLQ
jgi:folylpolyglutamate synthase/dihydropteroate synthase